LKSLINLEYQNVDWSKIKHSKFILSQSFEKIENNDIKLLLKQIVKKNYELEKTMVQLFYKLYNKTLKNNKCQKLYELINRTILLNSIINKVYEFTSKVVSNTDFVYETGILLQQMIKLLDILETYSLNILNEEKIFDVSNTIRNVKNVSELNNKIVQKNYRPIVLFKNRLNNYNLSYNILNIMIDEIEKYVMPISADEKVVQKIYSI